MQKLVTIYLDNIAYMQGKFIQSTQAKQHGQVEEHLATYLDAGWKIVSITGFGGSESPYARGWIAVVLQKDTV